MEQILSTIQLIIGSVAAMGGIIAVAFAYFRGRKDYKKKVQERNAKEVAKDAALAAKPKPTSADDRDSMRDGKF